MSGTIYFIGCTEASRVKIGFTQGSPYNRLAALQTGSPTRLVLAATISGDMSDERELHDKFAACRVRGEWFEMTDELFNHMAMIAWLTAADCVQGNKPAPDWLPGALHGTGASEVFPAVAGETLQ